MIGIYNKEFIINKSGCIANKFSTHKIFVETVTLRYSCEKPVVKIFLNQTILNLIELYKYRRKALSADEYM